MRILNLVLILIIIIIFYFFISTQDKPVGIMPEKNNEIKITFPEDLKEVTGIINVKGIADKKFKYVEIQMDLNGWEKANNVENWDYNLDTSKLEEGLHTVYARAYDNNYSKIKAIRINVKK